MSRPVRVAVKHDRRTLRAVAVLVDVGRDLGDPFDPEVPGRDVVPEPLQERQDEPADAGVDVAAQAVRRSQRSELWDGVHDPVRVVHGGRDDDRGGRRQPRLRSGDVGPVPAVEPEAHKLHPEVVRGLGVRRVGGVRREDLRPFDASGPGSLAAHEHRHEDRLGATRRHRAPALGRRVDEGGDRLDYLAFDGRQLGELERIEGVAEQKPRRRLAHHRFQVGAPGRVDEPEEPAAVNGRVLPLTSLELGEDLSRRSSGVVHGASSRRR